jgi:hypothetical protein
VVPKEPSGGIAWDPRSGPTPSRRLESCYPVVHGELDWRQRVRRAHDLDLVQVGAVVIAWTVVVAAMVIVPS